MRRMARTSSEILDEIEWDDISLCGISRGAGLVRGIRQSDVLQQFLGWQRQ